MINQHLGKQTNIYPPISWQIITNRENIEREGKKSQTARGREGEALGVNKSEKRYVNKLFIPSPRKGI